MTVILQVGAPVRSTATEPVVELCAAPKTPDAGWSGPHLTVHGRPAFEQSFWCGTCALLFRRLDGADHYRDPALLRDRLATGLDRLDDDVVRAFVGLLAPGRYLPLLLETTPELVLPGGERDYFLREQLDTWDAEQAPHDLPVDPATAYYRLDPGTPLPVPDGGVLFEFVVPMQAASHDDPDTVDRYARALLDGGTPTAVAVGVLDTAAPAVWTKPPKLDAQHWALTHFLLDGHHKARAAALGGQRLRLLCLLALDGGNTDPRYAQAVPALFDGAPADVAWPVGTG
ncbi:hypothetical protein [Streptacidiphilus rugosus]|uniref:hypothetical protein n=1 Tax=Streptacidiphilus rugosus TaxID=405783 RepID=UPI0012FA6B99|nr:hypothetical protein [Streptacidiphilus rugosus]